MKMVVAIIRHEKLQEVQDVLDECGVSGVTVTEVKGCGAQRGYTEKYRGTAVHISLRPRLKVEAVMQSEIVNTVVDKIAVAARADNGGELGDGHLAGVLARKLLDNRRHHVARATPVGVEIDNDRFLCVQHIGLESRAVEVLHVVHVTSKPAPPGVIPKPLTGENQAMAT